MQTAVEEIHNSGYSPDIMEKAILNKHFDIGDATNEELLFLIQELKNIQTENNSSDPSFPLISIIEKINIKARQEIVNTDKFFNNYAMITPIIQMFNSGQKISWNRNTPQYNAIKELHTDLSLIKDFESIQESS